MTTNHSNSTARGHALADELVADLQETYERIVSRVVEEHAHPAAQAIAVTQLATMSDVYQSRFLGSARQEALRRLRFPDGDYTGTPALGWREIGTMVGLTPTRAQQVADLPTDRANPRPRRTSP